jgi:hypothetical protein
MVRIASVHVEKKQLIVPRSAMEGPPDSANAEG